MIITKEYLIDNATTAGGYTRAQTEALGLKWGSLKSGWMTRLIGTELSDENAAIFESKLTAKEARGVAKPSYADLVRKLERYDKALQYALNALSHGSVSVVSKRVAEMLKD